MTYDLARVIGKNLEDKEFPNDWFPVFQVAGPTIIESFKGSFKDAAVGARWTVANLFSRPFLGDLLMNGLAYHITQLRESSWRWGKQMSRANNRETLNEKLLNIVEEATLDGLKNRIFSVKKIDAVAKSIFDQMEANLDYPKVKEPLVKKAERLEEPPLLLD